MTMKSSDMTNMVEPAMAVSFLRTSSPLDAIHTANRNRTRQITAISCTFISLARESRKTAQLAEMISASCDGYTCLLFIDRIVVFL